MSLVFVSLLVAIVGLLILLAAQSSTLRSRVGLLNRISERYLLVIGLGITLFSCGMFAVLGALTWLVPDQLEYSVVSPPNAVAGEDFIYVFYVRNAGDNDVVIEHLRFEDDVFDDVTVQSMRLYDLNRALNTSNGRDVRFSDDYEGSGLAVDVDQTIEPGSGLTLEVTFTTPFAGTFEGTLIVQQRLYDLVSRDTLTADFELVVAENP